MTEWRPIETAPTDIPILIGYMQQGDGMPRGQFVGIGTIYLNDGRRRLWVLNAQDREKAWPSHWMPLPEPPASPTTREIKFRAWFDGSEATYHPRYPKKGMYSDEELSGVGSYFYDWGVDQPEGFTLMQYTGLKDANGVEIYEGDIVAFNDGSHTTVQWDNFYAKFTPFHDETLGCPSGEDVKVIGNIYANPNLIGETV